jgi:hypothetical protein
MQAIKKLLLMPPLLALGCLIAGIYGALHDQVSYSASPDYFHAFKFIQFRISPHLHDRLGAAIVGWQATWWMGPIIGLPLFCVGLIISGWQAYLRSVLTAYGVAVLTAFAIGFGALATSYVLLTPENLPPFEFPEGVHDRVAFARVGIMHNFSYLGGVVGIITALTYLIWARWRTGRNTSPAVEVGSAD